MKLLNVFWKYILCASRILLFILLWKQCCRDNRLWGVLAQENSGIITLPFRPGKIRNRNRNPSLKLFIHERNKSVSNKQDNVPIKCSKLLCWIFFKLLTKHYNCHGEILLKKLYFKKKTKRVLKVPCINCVHYLPLIL